jgi:hypothetical protein
MEQFDHATETNIFWLAKCIIALYCGELPGMKGMDETLPMGWGGTILHADRNAEIEILVPLDTVGFRGSTQYQEWRKLLHHFFDPPPVVEHYERI